MRGTSEVRSANTSLENCRHRASPARVWRTVSGPPLEPDEVIEIDVQVLRLEGRFIAAVESTSGRGCSTVSPPARSTWSM